MPLETGTTLEDLDDSWPLGGDPTNKGDDHLRLIKAILKTQFPGELGDGFRIPITATEDELNYSVGLTGNIQGQLNAIVLRLDDLESTLPAPAGTVLSFFQGSAPSGWTQITSHNDKMLRVVSGGGGGSGGSDSPISKSWSINHNHSTPNFTLSTANMPAHTHQICHGFSSSGSRPSGFSAVENSTGPNNFGGGTTDDVWGVSNSKSAGSGSAKNIGNTGTTNLAFSFAPRYIDMIICSKDA